MDDDKNPFNCIFPPYEQCDKCGECAKILKEAYPEYSEDYEPSDEDIEIYIEEKILELEDQEYW